jgi:hypothetical protein
MPDIISSGDSARRTSPDVHHTTIHTTAVVPVFLEEIRKALSDTGWTMDAIASHMNAVRDEADGKVDKARVSRVLSGDNPMPQGFFDRLPHDAKGLFYKRQAEAHGHYVVSPAETVEDGARALIVGVLSAFAAFRLPTKAQQMARASVPNNQTKKVG